MSAVEPIYSVGRVIVDLRKVDGLLLHTTVEEEYSSVFVGQHRITLYRHEYDELLAAWRAFSGGVPPPRPGLCEVGMGCILTSGHVGDLRTLKWRVFESTANVMDTQPLSEFGFEVSVLGPPHLLTYRYHVRLGGALVSGDRVDLNSAIVAAEAAFRGLVEFNLALNGTGEEMPAGVKNDLLCILVGL